MTTDDSTRPSRHIDAALARIDEALEGAVHEGLDGMRWVPPDARVDVPELSDDRRYVVAIYGGASLHAGLRQALVRAVEHEEMVVRARAMGVELPDNATDNDIELAIGRALLGPVTDCIEAMRTLATECAEATQRTAVLTGSLRMKPPGVCVRHGDEMVGGRCRQCDRGRR